MKWMLGERSVCPNFFPNRSRDVHFPTPNLERCAHEIGVIRGSDLWLSIVLLRKSAHGDQAMTPLGTDSTPWTSSIYHASTSTKFPPEVTRNNIVWFNPEVKNVLVESHQVLEICGKTCIFISREPVLCIECKGVHMLFVERRGVGRLVQRATNVDKSAALGIR